MERIIPSIAARIVVCMIKKRLCPRSVGFNQRTRMQVLRTIAGVTDSVNIYGSKLQGALRLKRLHTRI